MANQSDADLAMDRLFGRVFATPQAKALLTALHRQGRYHFHLTEIIERVGRQRLRWGDLSESPLIIPDKDTP